MKLPEFVEYQSALQSPKLCFTDSEFKNCEVDQDSLGMPRPFSGGFALTYHLYLPDRTKQWAVRCFHKDVPDLRDRYDAISKFLAQHTSSLFTPIEYQPQGIRVQGQLYPITKMPWIEGQTLCFYIESHLHQPQLLVQLSQKIQEMATTLERLGVAHGDLQHGNILALASGELRLVDYDGFYVPALNGRGSADIGLPNYQHPRRQGSNFGPTMDRFSLLVLYLGIAGTAAKPDLWAKYSQGGNNILLTQEDFLKPDTSPVLRELEGVAGLSDMVRSFRSICKADLTQVPTLADFVTKRRIVTPSLTMVPVTARLQFPIVNAAEIDQLVRLEGNVVEVVGYVKAVREDYTKYGMPYAFVNCGTYWDPRGCFTIVLWSEALENFTVSGRSPQHYQDQWVSVTGLISVYRKSKYGPAPQITPRWPGEIRILSERQAHERMQLASIEVWGGNAPHPTGRTPSARASYSPRRPTSADRPLTQAEVESTLDRRYGQHGPLSRPLSPTISPRSSTIPAPRTTQRQRGSGTHMTSPRQGYSKRTGMPTKSTASHQPTSKLGMQNPVDFDTLIRDTWRKLKRMLGW